MLITIIIMWISKTLPQKREKDGVCVCVYLCIYKNTYACMNMI